MTEAASRSRSTRRVGAGAGRGPADPLSASPAHAELTTRDHRRNFKLGVINGALFRIGDVFIDTQMVLTWFLSQLGASNFLIGWVSPIRFGGSFLLQLLASGYMERKPYKLPFYRMISVFRSVVLLVFALLVALVPAQNTWLIVAFFAVLTLFSLGAGLVGIPFMDVVGKVVPPRRRGAFFSQRMFWGGILALAGSSAVGFLLAEPDGLVFPLNVSILFVLASVFLTATALSWSLVKEPPSPVREEEHQGLVVQLQRGMEILRTNPLYQRYALVRLCLTLAAWAAPFYIVYAERELGIPGSMLGLYLGARTVSGIASNLFWGRISARMGNQKLIVISIILGAATPLLALLIGGLHASTPGAASWLNYAYAIVFLTAGAFGSGLGIGITSYFLDLTPDDQRPLYLAFNNTLFGLARFTGLASGLIVDWTGFTALLLMSAGLYMTALLLSLNMKEPRVMRPSPPSASTA